MLCCAKFHLFSLLLQNAQPAACCTDCCCCLLRLNGGPRQEESSLEYAAPIGLNSWTRSPIGQTIEERNGENCIGQNNQLSKRVRKQNKSYENNIETALRYLILDIYVVCNVCVFSINKKVIACDCACCPYILFIYQRSVHYNHVFKTKRKNSGWQ